MIKIELDDKDAGLFKLFRQYQDDFAHLINAGAFNLQYGRVTLNVARGQIQNIMVEERKYERVVFTRVQK